MSIQGMPSKVDIWRKGEPVSKSSMQGGSSAGMGLTSPAAPTVPAGQYQQTVVPESTGGSGLGEKMRTESFAPETGSGTYAAHEYDPNLGYTPYKGSTVQEDESLWQKAKHALTGDTSSTTRDTARDTSYHPTGQPHEESLWQKTKHALGVDTDKDKASTSGYRASDVTYGGTPHMPTKTKTITTVTEGPPGSTRPGMPGQGTPSSSMTGQGTPSSIMTGQVMPSSSMTGQGMPSGMKPGEGGSQSEMMRNYPSSMQQGGGPVMTQGGRMHQDQPHVGQIGRQYDLGQQQRLEPQSYYAAHHTQGAMAQPHGGQRGHDMGHKAEPPSHQRGEMSEPMYGDMQKDRSALEQQHGAVAGSTGMMGSMPSGMMQQKDMGGMEKIHQPQHHGLTPQEIDDEQIGRVRQKGYAPLDLIQEPNRYVALFDLPGVFRDQISLCIDRGMLKMTVHRPENPPYPHHKHHRQAQESGLSQHPNPQFQGQGTSGGFGKVTVEDDQDDEFDLGVVKGIEHAYQRDMEMKQRSQLQSSQIRQGSGTNLAAPVPTSGMGSAGDNTGPSVAMRRSPNILPPGSQYLCRERPHGRIDRFIRLPHDIEETVSDAKLENGVLTVSIGRTRHHQRGGQQMGTMGAC